MHLRATWLGSLDIKSYNVACDMWIVDWISTELTQASGQQIAHKLIVVSHVEDAVDTGSHKLLLGVSKVTRHILRDKDDASLPIDNKEKPIEGLEERRKRLSV